MGKRELLIAAVFVFLGFGVYRLTAPPADPSRPGFSPGRIIDQIRREVRGQRATAETTVSNTHPVPATVTEIRLDFRIGAVTIVGEDRDDIEAEMHVRSTGYDTDEAERLAKASYLKFDEAGPLLIIAGKFPVEGRQTPTLRLKIPTRLGVRMDDKGNTLEITNVGSVLVGTGRGKTTIQRVAGSVTVTQRGNEVTITDVGSLKLNTLAGAEARVSRVRGDASFSLQTGDLRAEELRGGLEVEARNTEMQFDKLDKLKGPVRINASLGELVLVGLAAEARIDGRRTDIRVDHAGGAPLAIYNEGDESIEVTVPPVGFTMDALAVDGAITVDAKLEAAGLKSETLGGPRAENNNEREETRVTGAVRGGGPAITLRATRGDILLKAR
ncbi:MAG TPA: hypothetical protein VJ813_12900 [Vicinamibacterales bacterium]|nr:hypothetical protein [Vicinamibacterales bacterium]